MKKEGSHETRAVREVMLSTIGLGGRGTPVRVEGERKKRGEERIERGEEGGENEEYMSLLAINVFARRVSISISH